MKKLFALFVTLALLITAFAGCKANEKSDSESATSNTSPLVSSAPPVATGLKTGLAVISTTAKSTDAAGATKGLAQVDTTVVAVIVDKDGIIKNCFIDAVQSKMNFTSAGKLATEKTTVFKTKMELGTDYGMKKASGIGKEWSEQAAALAEYVKGKTVAQVKGIAVNEKGAPTGSDLKSSVTMSISGYITAIEKAVTTAIDAGAKPGDKLGLGIYTDMAKSTDVTAEKDGLAQAYSTYAAVTFDAENKITSCILDGSQGNVNFNNKGVITNKNPELKTKNELKEAYGMKKVSGIGKEWYEQATSFANYVKGNTAAEVKGIAVNAETRPTGADIMSSVTITIGNFKTVIDKANTNKK